MSCVGAVHLASEGQVKELKDQKAEEERPRLSRMEQNWKCFQMWSVKGEKCLLRDPQCFGEDHRAKVGTPSSQQASVGLCGWVTPLVS